VTILRCLVLLVLVGFLGCSKPSFQYNVDVEVSWGVSYDFYGERLLLGYKGVGAVERNEGDWGIYTPAEKMRVGNYYVVVYDVRYLKVLGCTKVTVWDQPTTITVRLDDLFECPDSWGLENSFYQPDRYPSTRWQLE